jgi:hypothetical protein
MIDNGCPTCTPYKEKTMPVDVDYLGLPEHMREAARAYVEDRHKPGQFLTAVLENNLVEAFGRADSTNNAAMELWASWLYNECPSAAWGSRGKVIDWLHPPEPDDWPHPSKPDA